MKKTCHVRFPSIADSLMRFRKSKRWYMLYVKILSQINAFMIFSTTVDKQLEFLKLGDSSKELGSTVGVAVKSVCLEKPK